jgi:hypothetical protein
MVMLRDGVLDPSLVTPEAMEQVHVVTRGYPTPPVEDAVRREFVGVTTDGRPIPGLFELEDTGLDPTPLVAAAEELWSELEPGERAAATQELDSPAWRMWTNAFPSWQPHGLRLEDLPEPKRDAVMGVVRATLSTQGCNQTREVMRLNGQLGRLVGQYPDSLTEWMYWFSIFGRPSVHEPWGWQIHGHHLDINCLILGRQLVLTPTFLGAEMESESLFAAERSAGLELINALSADQLGKARPYPTFADLPHELQGPVDGRHLGGAGQDNRVIPYEGLSAGDLTGPQRTLLSRLVRAWTGRMHEGPEQARIREIDRHLDDTHFVWYGPTGGDAAFYYRIHSPVVLIEYDNHPGIFLDNDEPEPFHVHTVVRTPNGNDYGRDVLRQHLALHPH